MDMNDLGFFIFMSEAEKQTCETCKYYHSCLSAKPGECCKDWERK